MLTQALRWATCRESAHVDIKPAPLLPSWRSPTLDRSAHTQTCRLCGTGIDVYGAPCIVVRMDDTDFVTVATTVRRATLRRLDEMTFAASKPGAMVTKSALLRWLLETWMADGGKIPESALSGE